MLHLSATLYFQAGPLEKVKVPDGKNFGFITFEHPVSVEYTIKLMQGIQMFGKTLRLQYRTGGTPSRQVSIELFCLCLQVGALTRAGPCEALTTTGLNTSWVMTVEEFWICRFRT